MRPHPARAEDAPVLDAWRDTPARAAIEAFVERTVADVPPAERIAVFDNDGTLWCEKPIPIQLDFIMRRFARMAEADTALRAQQPFKAAYEHDLHWLGAAMVKHYDGDDADVKLLITALLQAFGTMDVEDYERDVTAFFADARHPQLDRPYRGCAYVPMVELLRYLEANGFRTFIASGGDRDFMRAISEPVYGIPREHVIGSSFQLGYRDGDHGGAVVYKAGLDVFDDGPDKPVRIWSRVGRRPLLAGGNSNGDVPMLRYARGLRLLIRHDDAEREFDDARGAGDAFARAQADGWTVVSVKDDWETVFAAP
jgi:phosphoserine phosphatase